MLPVFVQPIERNPVWNPSARRSDMSDKEVRVPLSVIEELRQRRRLPVRLKREVPWSAEAGCTIFIGMFVLAIVGGLFYALTHVKAGEKDLWIAYAFIPRAAKMKT